jgi:hypothetical protein
MGKFHNIGGSKCTINHQHKGRNKTGLIHNENWLTQCLFQAVICGCLKKHDCSPSHLIHLIKHLVTSFSFCGYNCSYKCTVSIIPLKYRNDCWLSYMWFQKLSFSSGKGTQMTNNKGKDIFHYRLCPGTYGHALIKMKNFSPTDVLWNSRCSPNILI